VSLRVSQIVCYYSASLANADPKGLFGKTMSEFAGNPCLESILITEKTLRCTQGRLFRVLRVVTIALKRAIMRLLSTRAAAWQGAVSEG
jgi:hypothetical protein